MKVQETSRGVEIFEFLGFGNTISAIGCSFELFSIINTENCLRLECAYWQACTNRGGGGVRVPSPIPHAIITFGIYRGKVTLQNALLNFAWM